MPAKQQPLRRMEISPGIIDLLAQNHHHHKHKKWQGGPCACTCEDLMTQETIFNELENY